MREDEPEPRVGAASNAVSEGPIMRGAHCMAAPHAKGNPGDGGHAGVQKQANSDGGSYPAALLA